MGNYTLFNLLSQIKSGHGFEMRGTNMMFDQNKV